MDYDFIEENDPIVSHKEALTELSRHGVSDDEMLQEFYDTWGDRDEYKALDILNWLGY